MSNILAMSALSLALGNALAAVALLLMQEWGLSYVTGTTAVYLAGLCVLGVKR